MCKPGFANGAFRANRAQGRLSIKRIVAPENLVPAPRITPDGACGSNPSSRTRTILDDNDDDDPNDDPGLDFRNLSRMGPRSKLGNRAFICPSKRFLEKLGFTVKGEIGGCDLVALSGDEPPLVVVGELKLSFNLELVVAGGRPRPAACRRGVARRQDVGERARGREKRRPPNRNLLPPARLRHAGG